ncbi:MAG: ROK family protein [Armatimonadota bacterium]
MKTAIGVDIGGTNLLVAHVREDGRIFNVAREETPCEAEEALELLLEMVRDLYCTTKAQASPPVGIGLSFGGPVDYEAQAIVRSHHVEGWAPGLKLAEVFAQEFRTRAIIDNDANCGGYGEALYGAAKGCGSALYVNIGTGIGGAVIIGGRVHHGAHSTAGEIGHTVVLPGGPLCTCDKHGCLEALSSGSALAREGRAAGLGDDVTGKEVGQRALDGEAVALRVVEQAGHWLGVALGNACNLFDPKIIVIGGGVAGLGEPYLGPAREQFAATVMPAAAGTPIVAAELGYEAGAVGAAAMMFYGG